jgi:heptosyltransferase-1
MRVLIIKLSSMGDLMHAMPALTDAAKQFPEIEFDWVVDQAFAEVPLWHPNVKRVIKTAHRKWKKTPIKAFLSGELTAFRQQLKRDDYDLVIDLQGNIKSAVVSWLSNRDVAGFDKQCCREKPAHWAYKYQYSVNLQQHSVEKLRDLMAMALGYERPQSDADYGVDFSSLSLPEFGISSTGKYLVFVHNASWLTKLWPLESWQQLVKKAVKAGYSVVLPCGNDEEHQRAQQIAALNEHAYALPRLPLNAMAALIQHADGAVCSDTGLAHLAAMIGRPAVTIYGATDTELIGTKGLNQQHLISDFECSPCYKRICPHNDSQNGEPVCMREIDAERVWQHLQAIMSND